DNAPANAIDEALMSELESASEELANDEEVRVVVLASNHEKTFVAGLDLKNAMQPGTDGDDDENPIAKESARMQACFRSSLKCLNQLSLLLMDMRSAVVVSWR